MTMRAVALLLPRRREELENYMAILARAGEDGADAVIEQLTAHAQLSQVGCPCRAPERRQRHPRGVEDAPHGHYAMDGLASGGAPDSRRPSCTASHAIGR